MKLRDAACSLEGKENSMAITRQVITSLLRDGTDMLGTKNVAVKIVDESIVSGSLLSIRVAW